MRGVSTGTARVPHRQPGLRVPGRSAADFESRSRSTCAPSTSRASNRCPVRRARCSARARRPARCATSPTSPTRPSSPLSWISRAARPRVVSPTTTSAAGSTFRSPRTSPSARVGFFAQEGGYIDNVLGRTLLRRSRQRRRRRGRLEQLRHRTAAASRRAGRSTRTGKRTLSLIAPESDPRRRLGDRPGARRLQDHALLRRVSARTTGRRCSLNFKGNLGFAELSVTGSYFDRNIEYEWDNRRPTTSGARCSSEASSTRPVTLLRHRRATLRHRLPDGTTYNWQQQNRSTYEVRLTSLGESRFKWMAGAFFEDVDDWWDNGREG